MLFYIGIHGIAEHERRSTKHRCFSYSLCDWRGRNSPVLVEVHSPFHITCANILQIGASFRGCVEVFFDLRRGTNYLEKSLK